jgi:hypothetical protein
VLSLWRPQLNAVTLDRRRDETCGIPHPSICVGKLVVTLIDILLPIFAAAGAGACGAIGWRSHGTAGALVGTSLGSRGRSTGLVDLRPRDFLVHKAGTSRDSSRSSSELAGHYASC